MQRRSRRSAVLRGQLAAITVQRERGPISFPVPRGTESSKTLRRSKPDSNHQYRARSPCISLVSALVCAAFRLRGTKGRRYDSLWKPWSVSRGTDGSNPLPSSRESVSALNPSAGGEECRGFAAVCPCVRTREGTGWPRTRPSLPFFSGGRWRSPTLKATAIQTPLQTAMMRPTDP